MPRFRLRAKLRPRGRATTTFLSFGASVPAVSVNASFGRPLATPVSDPRDCLGWPWTVQLNVVLPNLPRLSTAWTVTLETPAVVGEPEIVPLVAPIDSPDGNPVAVYLTGYPALSLALTWTLAAVCIR